jgi:inhibitor of cysteine peptidase
MHFNIARSSLQNEACCLRRNAAAAATSFVMALATIALIGCLASQKVVASPTAPSSSTSVTEQDDGKSIELLKGQTLFVRLASNPTTGYQWKLRGDTAPLDLVKSDFSGDTHSGNKVGVGGTESFQFTAKAAGKAVLKLEYRRPWEKDVPAAKTFTLTVVVK